MKPKTELNISNLRKILKYDPISGDFSWIASRAGRFKPGARAGYKRPNGYVRINFNGSLYYAHRLAWLFVHDRWPSNEIDHIDGDPSNNRIENLREATRAENCQNVKASAKSASQLLGAHYDSISERWLSQIAIDGRNIALGFFNSAEEAHTAYKTAKRKYHKFQPEVRG